MADENKYLSMSEASQYARITRAALYTALKKGKLRAIKKGHFWRFTHEDLDAYRIKKYNRDERKFNGERIFSAEKGTFSINQAAKIISHELNTPYNCARIYYLIRIGELKVSKLGATFIITRESLIDLIEKERGTANASERA